jgi:hypothetical protein
MRSMQRQLQTLVRLKAARSIHHGPRTQLRTPPWPAPRRADSPGGAAPNPWHSLSGSGHLVKRAPHTSGRLTHIDTSSTIQPVGRVGHLQNNPLR